MQMLPCQGVSAFGEREQKRKYFGVMQNKEVQFSVKQLKVNDPFDVKYFLS
jgi:hypothetical protein